MTGRVLVATCVQSKASQLRHMLRVGCYSIVESRKNGVDERAMLNMLTAAVLHDMWRENDNRDPGHGVRAAEWFRDSADSVGEAFGVVYALESILEPTLVGLG